jgi:hypothetical protein
MLRGTELGSTRIMIVFIPGDSRGLYEGNANYDIVNEKSQLLLKSTC